MNRNWLLINAVVGAGVYLVLNKVGGELVSNAFLVFWFTWGIGNVVNLLGVMNSNQVTVAEAEIKMQAQALAAQGVTSCDKEGEKKKNPIGFLWNE